MHSYSTHSIRVGADRCSVKVKCYDIPVVCASDQSSSLSCVDRATKTAIATHLTPHSNSVYTVQLCNHRVVQQTAAVDQPSATACTVVQLPCVLQHSNGVYNSSTASNGVMSSSTTALSNKTRHQYTVSSSSAAMYSSTQQRCVILYTMTTTL